MILEIITPEKIIFTGEVESVAVPGVNGEFEMLNNHAAIVSLSLIHISEPTRPEPISYAVFCLKKKICANTLFSVRA